MITVPAHQVDGVLCPAVPLPPGAVKVVCNGTEYRCYLPWDELPPEPPPPEPTAEEIIAALTKAMEDHYDATAHQRRYDNRLTCALRAGYPGPFQAEGLAFAVWMDTCNAYGYQVMGECLYGLRQIPTAEELLAELPVMVWPT